MGVYVSATTTISVSGDPRLVIGAGDVSGDGVQGVGVAYVDGDGIADWLLGAAEAENALGLAEAGRAYLLLGPHAADADADADTIIEGLNAFEHAGRAVALGDLHGEGLGDLVVGVPRPATGFVLYGLGL